MISDLRAKMNVFRSECSTVKQLGFGSDGGGKLWKQERSKTHRNQEAAGDETKLLHFDTYIHTYITLSTQTFPFRSSLTAFSPPIGLSLFRFLLFAFCFLFFAFCFLLFAFSLPCFLAFFLSRVSAPHWPLLFLLSCFFPLGFRFLFSCFLAFPHVSSPLALAFLLSCFFPFSFLSLFAFMLSHVSAPHWPSLLLHDTEKKACPPKKEGLGGWAEGEYGP